jgi:ATP-dependent Clp protease ATP-binding subunit ClpC
MDTMEPITFNYNSNRASQARIGQSLKGTLHRLFFISAVLLVLIGLGLLVIEIAIGWVVVGLAAIPYMIHQWHVHSLAELPTATQSKTIDDILAGDILGQLPKEPTPRQIATAVSRVSSGQFFEARFGVTARFIQEIASEDPAATPALWKEAWTLRELTGQKQISGGILLVALVRTFPGYEGILAHLQIDGDDLVHGLRWRQHIEDLIKQHAKPRRTGGIARDWSFGYIPLLTRFGQNISEQIMRGGLLSSDLEAHTQALDK